jgi:hypothetical protein
MIAQKRPNAIAKSILDLYSEREKEQKSSIIQRRCGACRHRCVCVTSSPLPEVRGYRFAHHQSCYGEDRQLDVAGVPAQCRAGSWHLAFSLCF